MGSSIAFYCGNTDIAALSQFAQSLGLHLVPMQLDREDVGMPENGPACFLSTIQRENLHPYGTPPVKISDVTDPLMLFMRAYHKPPYLVLGHVKWNDDKADFAAITRPYYQKIARWIRAQWRRPEGWDFYCGPEATQLLENGAQTVNFLPDVPIEQIIVE